MKSLSKFIKFGQFITVLGVILIGLLSIIGSSSSNSPGAGGGTNDPAGGGEAGIVTWAKTFGSEGSEFACAVDQTDDDNDGEKDDGFIVAGTTDVSGDGGRDVLLQKIDSAGEVEWAKTFGVTNIPLSVATAAQPTDDGGYILVKNRNPGPPGQVRASWLCLKNWQNSLACG